MNRLWGYVLMVTLAAIVTGVILNAVLRCVPGLVVILPFYVFWWSQKMTWESEFAYDANRLLGKAKR